MTTKKTRLNFYKYCLKNKLILIASSATLTSIMLGYVVWGYIPKYTAHTAVLVKDSAIKAKYLTSDPYETTSSVASSSILNVMSLLNTKVISDALYSFLQTEYPTELKRLQIRSVDEWNDFFEDGSSIIHAKNKPGTDIITIKVTWWQNPAIAANAAQAVTKALTLASLDVNKAEQIERYKNIAEQYKKIKEKLEQVRSRLSHYQSATNTVNIDQEIVESANSRAMLQNSLSQTIAESQAKQAQFQKLKSTLAMTPEEAMQAVAVGGNNTLTKLYDKYYQLSQDYAQISANYTDESPKASELLSQIQQTNTNIQQELSRGIGKNSTSSNTSNRKIFSDEAHMHAIGDYLQVQAEAAMLSHKAATLKQLLDQMNSRFKSIPSIKENTSNLKQEEDSLSESLKTLQIKMLDTQIKESQSSSNVFIIDPPRVPTKADMPRIPHLLLLSTFMGFIVGIGIVYLKWVLMKKKELPLSLDEIRKSTITGDVNTNSTINVN